MVNGEPPPGNRKVEHACLKTIAASLNAHGGSLVIGVNDSGAPGPAFAAPAEGLACLAGCVRCAVARLAFLAQRRFRMTPPTRWLLAAAAAVVLATGDGRGGLPDSPKGATGQPAGPLHLYFIDVGKSV